MIMNFLPTLHVLTQIASLRFFSFLEKVAVFHTIKFKEEIIDDKTYWKVISYKVNMKPEQISFKFDNLFNGNKLLSDRLHAVVNEHWQPLWLESKNDFEKVYSNLYTEFSKKLFDNVPIDSVFKL